MTPEQVDRLVADLRSFAASALDSLDDGPGRSRKGERRAYEMNPLTLLGVVRIAERLSELMPALLHDARDDAANLSSRLESTLLPTRATWPRTPAAYERMGERIYPRFWVTPERTLRAREELLRWLLGQVFEVRRALERLSAGAGEYVSELEDVTKVVDVWTRRDLERARTYRERIDKAQGALGRATAALYREAGRRIAPGAQMPDPIPRTVAWNRMRRLAAIWKNPTRYGFGYFREALLKPVQFEDLPYLYQRWCAVQLLQVLQIAGWKPVRQPQWAVIMGGRCELLPPVSTKHPIVLWFEPHIGTEEHASGLRLRHGMGTSVSPDILLQFWNQEGVQWVVLDPSLTTDREQLRTKGRYLRMLESSELRKIAGVPVGTRRVLRSWALAPQNRPQCDVLHDDGSVGIVPLAPGKPRRPLQEFLDDLLVCTA